MEDSPIDKKVRRIVVLVVAYFIFVILTAALNYIFSVQIYFLLFCVVLIFVALISFLPQSSLPTEETKEKKDWFNLKIIAGLILLIVFPLAFSVISSGPSEEVYPAEELQKYITAGNWELENETLSCSGNCELIIPNEKTISNVIIIPGTITLDRESQKNIGGFIKIKSDNNIEIKEIKVIYAKNSFISKMKDCL